jgi:hypothetical protein
LDFAKIGLGPQNHYGGPRSLGFRQGHPWGVSWEVCKAPGSARMQARPIWTPETAPEGQDLGLVKTWTTLEASGTLFWPSGPRFEARNGFPGQFCPRTPKDLKWDSLIREDGVRLLGAQYLVGFQVRSVYTYNYTLHPFRARAVTARVLKLEIWFIPSLKELPKSYQGSPH